MSAFAWPPLLPDSDLLDSPGVPRKGERVRVYGKDGATLYDVVVADVIVEKDEHGCPTGSVTIVPTAAAPEDET